MASNTKNTRHKNSEILAILDEARIAASEGNAETASTLISVARSFYDLIRTDGHEGFIVERTYKEVNRNPLVDNDD